MVLQFEGDFENVSVHQLNFITSVLKDLGFNDGIVQVSPVGKADDNYVANVKRLAVEKDGETFNMVAKIATTNELVRAKTNTKRLFQTEHVMYTDVLPKFTELEVKANVPVDERLRYPKCYGSLNEHGEVILLEDLQVSNFSMLDKSEPIDSDTVKLVLDNFAILHSLSYALKTQEPATYEEFKTKLVNNWAVHLQSQDLKGILDKTEERYISVMENDEQKNVLRGSTSKLLEHVVENHEIDMDSVYGVIQQGDCWTNNMLFKFEGDRTMQCCMIDYQIASQNSPVADIMYMIFACTDYETRSKHYHEWIDYYHAKLDKSLAYHDLKADIVYPRDQLNADLKRFGKYSLVIAMILSNTLLVDAAAAALLKEALQSGNEEEVYANFFEEEKNIDMTKFRARAIGLVQSFLELEYL